MSPPSSLRILHLLAPAPVGGLERVVQTLALGLHERGHEIHVCPIGSDGDPIAPFISPLLEAAVSVSPIRVAARHYLSERREVEEKIREFQPHIVHTHGYRADVVDSGVARRLGVPTVTTVHGFTGNGLRNRLYEALQRRSFRHMDAVVAVSDPLEASLRRSGVRAEALTTIPNARPVQPQPLDRREARAALGSVPDDVFHIGWVGRLTPEKGPDVFVEALRRLSDLPAAVSILGDGPQRRELAGRLRDSDTACEARWHGTVAVAGRLFPAFDLFVLSSRTEGTPIVLFEAMEAGVPIVATRVGGVPDVVSEREAFLVPPEDPEHLAAAIRQARNDPEGARERAKRAGDRLRTTYARTPWIRRYEDLYLRVAGRERAASRSPARSPRTRA